MTKQEEIREGIAILLYRMSGKNAAQWIDIGEGEKGSYRKNAQFMMMMLADKDVVIKVDSKLPESRFKLDTPTQLHYETAQQDMVFAGFVAVEPLVKEK